MAVAGGVTRRREKRHYGQPAAELPAGATEREFGSVHRALWCRAGDRVATTAMVVWLVGFWVALITWRLGGIDGRTALIAGGCVLAVTVLATAVASARPRQPASLCRHRISWPTRLVVRFDRWVNQLGT